MDPLADAAPIFKQQPNREYLRAYDNQNRPAKNTLLTSLGNDLSSITGDVWDVDKPEIRNSIDNFINTKAEYLAKGVNIERNPEAYKKILGLKQDIIDLAAKSKYDRRTYEYLSRQMTTHPENYLPEDTDNLVKFRESGIKRAADPGISELSANHFNEAIAKMGKPENFVRKEVALNGGISKVTADEAFDEDQAKAAYHVWASQGENSRDRDYMGLRNAITKDVNREYAIKGISPNDVSVIQRAADVEKKMMDYFVDIKKAQFKDYHSTVYKNTPTGGDANVQVTVSAGGGVNVGKVKWDYGVQPVKGADGKTHYQEVWTAEDKGDSGNDDLLWSTEDGTPVNGKLKTIHKDENGKLVIDVAYYDMVRNNMTGKMEKSGSPKIVQVPYDKQENKQKVTTNYNIEPEELRNKYFKGREAKIKPAKWAAYKVTKK